jgi:hypothetical protein
MMKWPIFWGRARGGGDLITQSYGKMEIKKINKN